MIRDYTSFWNPIDFERELKELDPQKKFHCHAISCAVKIHLIHLLLHYDFCASSYLKKQVVLVWGDENGNGKTLKLDMHSLKKNFNYFVEANVNTENLISFERQGKGPSSHSKGYAPSDGRLISVSQHRSLHHQFV
jgi:hypothetical protein